MQAAAVDREDSKCLVTADNSRATSINVNRVTADDVTTSSVDVDGPCVVDSRQLSTAEAQVFVEDAAVDDEDYGIVERVIPVEANVVLVSRPGADNPDELRNEPSVYINDRLTATADNDSDIGSCQSTRAPRRHRKRSSLCNNVNVDDVVIDVQHDAGQSDVLTTVKRTSVSHQRHAEVGDREHRPKRKGNVFLVGDGGI